MERRFVQTSEERARCNLPLVAAVTVNWNGLQDTFECVASLRQQSYDNIEIIVVDNASDGDDVARLTERFGDSVTVVCNDTNLGCAGGYNSGIRYARTHSRPDFILAINNDVVADVDMVAVLVQAAESDPTAGLIGPKIYYYDLNGRTDIIWSAGGDIHRWGLKIHSQRGDGEPDEGQFDAMEEVDWISGAALLIRPGVLEDAGYFNTWYFIGHEDIELSLKALAAGHRILYAPHARAWHKVGASARKLGISYADPAAYFYLIKHTFPLHVYLYHVALFPLLLARWGVLFLVRSRDRAQLQRFIADLKRLLTGSRRA